MIRTPALPIALLLAFAAPASAMKKGTVKFFNDAKGFGRAAVVVIEPGDPNLDPGDTVVISGQSVTGLAVGDIVSFDPPASGECNAEPANLKVLGKATIVEAGRAKSVDLGVGPGEVVIVRGGSVRGSIDIQGGALLLAPGATFDGTIESRDDSFVLVEAGATLGGKLESRAAAALILRGDVTGHVRSKGDDYVLLKRSGHQYVGTVTIVK